LELFVLVVCRFTEMTSLDQHVLMNMQVAGSVDTVDFVDFPQSRPCRIRLCRRSTELKGFVF